MIGEHFCCDLQPRRGTVRAHRWVLRPVTITTETTTVTIRVVTVATGAATVVHTAACMEPVGNAGEDGDRRVRCYDCRSAAIVAGERHHRCWKQTALRTRARMERCSRSMLGCLSNF